MSVSRVFLVAVLVLSLSGCKALINQLAFHPDNTNLPDAGELPPGVEEILIETEDGVELTSLYLPSDTSKHVLIYFHGNGRNLYRRLSSYIKLREMGINVLAISYRGYGKSEGTPTEKGIYTDGEAALKYATEVLGFSEDQILLFGRSIGSTVAVEIAQNRGVMGIVLVTPLTSGKDMAKEIGLSWFSSLAGDAFDNLTKIESSQAPLLIVHGTEDKITPFFMGQELFEQASVDKEFIRIEGGRHNDLHITFGDEYWSPIETFISELMTPGI